MDYDAQERLLDFFAWVEACPDVSRRENDELTQRIARLMDENRGHPHRWFLAAVFRTVGDVEFVEDKLMGTRETWPGRDGDSDFAVDRLCGRIMQEFSPPENADIAYGSCFVLCHLWSERDLIEFHHRDEESWEYLLTYPVWGDNVAPDVLADLGSPIKLRVSRSAQSALNRVLGRPLNAAWARNAAAVAIDQLAASAPPHLALNGVGVEFALRRYEECRGWDDTEEGAEA